MTGLAPALFLGAVAAVVVPWFAQRNEATLGGVLAGQMVRLPVSSGTEFPWSWLVFCVVTLVAWAGIAAAKTE